MWQDLKEPVMRFYKDDYITPSFQAKECCVSGTHLETELWLYVPKFWGVILDLLTIIGQPICDEFGKIIILSLFRTPRVNAETIGAHPCSLHMQGRAMDFTTEDKNLLFKIFKFLKESKFISQLYLYRDKETKEPIYIHVAMFKHTGQERCEPEVMTIYIDKAARMDTGRTKQPNA
jgi:hypothetical protein